MGNVRSLSNKMDKLAALTRPHHAIPDIEGGKRKGGGLAVFVNDRWCNPGHIIIKEHICRKGIELLAVSMRPYYLRKEFLCVIDSCLCFPQC